MKKTLILTLALTLLLLTGCAGSAQQPMDKALQFRSDLLAAQGCSFQAEVTADYGQRTCTFAARCSTDSEGTLTFEITAPETLAGITGALDAKGGKLTFDGAALEFGVLVDGALSPVSAPYVLSQSWRTGYITACGVEGAGLRITVETASTQGEVLTDTWLDREKGVPIYGEVCYNGRRILSITVAEFQMKETGSL